MNKNLKDVGRQQGGFRLQKLRAAELMLSSTFQSKNDEITSYTMCAVETEEDVHFIDKENEKTYLEQNKQYSTHKNFTFNNIQVLKSFANFLHCWIDRNYSEHVSFGFYCTNNIGKENLTESQKSQGLKLPEQPILELLSQKDFSENDWINSAATILSNYIDSLTDEDGQKGVIAKTISDWEQKDWVAFFEKVDVKFQQEDADVIKKKLVQQISNIDYPANGSKEGLEVAILAQLIELFDKRQGQDNPVDRFVTSADVRLIFQETVKSQGKIYDSIGEINLNKPEDGRRLEEKIESVCPQFNPKKIKFLNLAAISGMHLYDKNKNDLDFKSFRSRVFQSCYEELLIEISSTQANLSESKVNALISKLTDKAKKDIAELSTDFRYPISNSISIREVVLELFDSCYLAFDEAQKSVQNDQS